MRNLSSICAAAVLAVSALGAASPASAAIVISLGGQTAQGQTVQFQTQQTAQSVTGFTNMTNTAIVFSNELGLATQGVGQAVVSGNNAGTVEGTNAAVLFGTTDILAAAALGYLEFNLVGIPGNEPPPEAVSALFTALDANGNLIGSTTTQLSLNGNGNNFINLTGNGVEFSGVRIQLQPAAGGVSSLQNVRVSAVPEPTTWAMMLVGFGAVGYSMRRRKVTIGARQLV
jgi:hypothetical protein